MSLESFKKQAGRLVAYLGKHHKLRLKHSNALEAVAAVHGARNWATLQAKGAPPDTAGPEAGAGRGRAASGGGMPLAWRDGVPKLFVSQADWSRHTLAEGVPYYTLAWLEEHLLNCKRTFAGGVFINVVEGGRLPLILDLHRDVEEETTALEYNLFAGLSVDEVCDVLMHAYPAQPRSAVRGHIRSLCGLALNRLLPKELPPHESLSLSIILLALRPAALRYHMAQDPQLAEELRGLAQVSSNGSEDEEHLIWALDSAFGPLTRELLRLKDGEYGPALFSSKSFAQGSRSVVDCFARGDLLHVTLPDDEGDGECLRRMWMEVMGHAARRRRSVEGGMHKPAILGIGRCKYFAGPALASLAEQARGVDLVLLLTTGSELELRNSQAGQRILANVYNRMHLGPPHPELVEQMVRDLEGSTVQLRSPSSTSFF